MFISSKKANSLLTCTVCLHCLTIVYFAGRGCGCDEQGDGSWAVSCALKPSRRQCAPAADVAFISAFFFFFFSMSHPNTQRGPGSHADEPVLGRELEPGSDHAHAHTHSHGYQCFADRLGVLELALPPPSMLWPPCCQRPLRVCGEGEHKHARLTLWELTGPPVSEGQAESVV